MRVDGEQGMVEGSLQRDLRQRGGGHGPDGKPKCRQAHAISGSQPAPPEKEEETLLFRGFELDRDRSPPLGVGRTVRQGDRHDTKQYTKE